MTVSEGGPGGGEAGVLCCNDLARGRGSTRAVEAVETVATVAAVAKRVREGVRLKGRARKER